MQPINNQNPPVINEYPYYYWQFPPNMYGFPPPNFHQYIDSPKDLKENINDIYQRGIVNNIIGAFFIQEFKEKKNISEKKKVPISMVELGDDQDINILNKGDKENSKIFDGQNNNNYSNNEKKEIELNKNIENNKNSEEYK